MAAHTTGSSDPFTVLSCWCCATSSWRDLPGQYQSVGAAEFAATDRGIYRVVFVCGERRLGMEPFAVVGNHPADDARQLAERPR